MEALDADSSNESAPGDAGDPLALPVSALMSESLIGCDPSEPLAAAAWLMSEKRIHVLVVRSGRGAPFALLSDRDLLTALGSGEDPARVQVGEVAATEPVTVLPTATAAEAAALMRDHDVSHVFVVEAGPSREPLGVVSSVDLAQAVIERAPTGD